jgi:CO/xanthine dehydrogenase FAD-binding subunit
MRRFEFYAPKSLGEAVRFLSEKGSRTGIIAGGTDLIPKLREGVSQPDFVLNLLEIEELNGIREANQVLHIGATTTHTQIAESSALQRTCPALVQAAAAVGGPLVRNRGTIGGNLANASPAADLACALLALEAEAVLRSEKRIRVVPLGDFFVGPGQTMINPDELLTEVSIRPPRGKCVFRKLGRRQAMSLSIVNAAVCLEMEGKICRKSRIALGSVAPTPIRCHEAEMMLANKEIGPELISKCAGAAVALAKPIDDQRAKAWYRVEAGTVLLKRALAEAAGLQGGR